MTRSSVEPGRANASGGISRQPVGNDVTFVSGAGTCGGALKATVSLKNDTAVVWSGHVELAGQTGPASTLFEVLAHGTREVVVSSPLNCGAPLGHPEVSVYRDKAKIASKTMEPGQLIGGAVGNGVLQHLLLNASCRQATGSFAATLKSSGFMPVSVNLGLFFNGESNPAAYQLLPNQQTVVSLPLTKTVNCQTGAGLLRGQWSMPGLTAASPTNGQVDIQTVTYDL